MDTNSENTSAQLNEILAHLKGKNINQWTPEEQLEKELSEEIHYYTVRGLLPTLVKDKHVEHTRFGNSYMITAQGRRFMTEGGYKE